MFDPNCYNKIVPRNVGAIEKIAEIGENKINAGAWYLDDRKFLVATNDGLFLFDISKSLNRAEELVSSNVHTNVCLINSDLKLLALNNNGFSLDKNLQVGFFVPKILNLSSKDELNLGISKHADDCMLRANRNGTLLAAAAETEVYIWDVIAKKLVFSEEGNGICWSGNNNLIYLTLENEIINYSTKEKQYEVLGKYDADAIILSSLDVIKSTKSLVGVFENEIIIWDEDFNQTTLDSYGGYRSSLSPEESLLAVIGDGADTLFFDTNNMNEPFLFDSGYGNCEHIEFSPSGKFVAIITSTDKVVFYGITANKG